MFVKQNKSHKGILLTYTIGYRENGKVKHKNVETIGYLEDLKKKYDDPIAHFTKLAKNKSKNEINELVIKNLNSKLIDSNTAPINIGYFVLKSIYNSLNLNSVLKEKQKKLKIDYDLNSIMQLLVFSRILFPASKKETYNNRNVFFDNYNFSLIDLYRSLDYFQSLKDDLVACLWNETKNKYNRDASKTYYDCTNYYFEIPYNDTDLIDEDGNILIKNYRKKGPSKEHRPEPIIGMGLLMDSSGLPLTYDLYPGNESEKKTLLPTIRKVKRKFDVNKTIVVADRGLNTSDNTFFLAGKNDDYHTEHDGYVYGQSVRGADQEFKDWVLKDDYEIDILNDDGEEISFKHKSRVVAKTITIERDGSRKNKVNIYQKQMVYYSKKYDDKQKKERALVIQKANDLIKNPGKYTRATSVGAAGYVNNISFNNKTGEVIAQNLSLNEEKIKEEEKYDGYYSIVTSEKNLTDIEIRNIYKGLWKIEETFKITKSVIEARPVYVWTKEHIEAHFLICFISLVIIRLLEKDLNNKYYSERIINSLKNLNITKLEHDIYIQNYSDEITKELSNIYSINYDNKYISLSNLKKNLKT